MKPFLDHTIHIQEKINFSKEYLSCRRWIFLALALEFLYILAMGLIRTLLGETGKYISMILLVIGLISMPVITINAKKQEGNASRISYKTALICSAMHTITIICWCASVLLANTVAQVAADKYFMLLWLPQAVAAYLMALLLLVIRPGKKAKYITHLHIREIEGEYYAWIHREKAFSADLNELVEQRYAFPIKQLNFIHLEDGGQSLVLDGYAKYLVWPFHMGDEPNLPSDIQNTYSSHYNLVLRPKNDKELAKGNAFFNAVITAMNTLDEE